MRIKKNLLTICTIGLALVSTRSAAQGISFDGVPTRTALTPPENAFIQSHVAAVSGTDIEQYKRLLS